MGVKGTKPLAQRGLGRVQGRDSPRSLSTTMEFCIESSGYNQRGSCVVEVEVDNEDVGTQPAAVLGIVWGRKTGGLDKDRRISHPPAGADYTRLGHTSLFTSVIHSNQCCKFSNKKTKSSRCIPLTPVIVHNLLTSSL